VLNAAAALIIAGRIENLREGAKLASDALDSGKAAKNLEKILTFSRETT
jgi:anthranilate phosphoribosyltransferase